MFRYWCKEGNVVKDHYSDSTFLGHAKEQDLLANFNKVCTKLYHSKIFHASMDGPSVNLAFLIPRAGLGAAYAAQTP